MISMIIYPSTIEKIISPRGVFDGATSQNIIFGNIIFRWRDLDNIHFKNKLLRWCDTELKTGNVGNVKQVTGNRKRES